MNLNFTIFYTDDDEDDLILFEEAASTLKSVRVETYNHADKLLHAIANPPPSPQIIFLDLNMPGKNGFEVLQELRESEEHRDIPIVIYSTSSEQNSIAKCKELGANLYIVKPFSLEGITKSIEHALAINWQMFKPSLNDFVYKKN